MRKSWVDMDRREGSHVAQVVDLDERIMPASDV